MLGGGTYTTQNKVLPGSYINFVSAARASVTLADRGVVALPIALNWGKVGEVYTITSEDFEKNSMSLFGYAYTAPQVKPFRELFKHAQKVHVYNLNDGEGTQASLIGSNGTFAVAKYAGVAGNQLKLVVQQNVDDTTKYDVSLYMGNTLVDKQTGKTTDDLKDNDYVTWGAGNDLSAFVTTGINFENGENGAKSNTSYQNALDAFEAYNFNVLCCDSTDKTVVDLFVAFTKRMRDKVGVKFQLVEGVGSGANYEGVISVVTNGTQIIYWAAGALAGCAVNQSCTNMSYNGELTDRFDYTQTELEQFIGEGKFAFHMVENEVRVLMDINSFISSTTSDGVVTTDGGGKNELFSSNQVIRVIDQCGNDTARIFNTKYLGKVQNDKSGRVSLWSDIVTHRRKLESIRAIENYNSDDLVVSQGEKKNSVAISEVLTPTVAMEKLYMTTVIE